MWIRGGKVGAYLVAAHAGGNYEVGGVDVWEGFGVLFETVGTCSVDELSSLSTLNWAYAQKPCGHIISRFAC
jgi:hypothetical protein